MVALVRPDRREQGGGGASVRERRCLGEGGVEVGYAKRQGSLNVYNRASTIYVTPAFPGRAECLSDVRRGSFPCIESYAVE